MGFINCLRTFFRGSRIFLQLLTCILFVYRHFEVLRYVNWRGSIKLLRPSSTRWSSIQKSTDSLLSNEYYSISKISSITNDSCNMSPMQKIQPSQGPHKLPRLPFIFKTRRNYPKTDLLQKVTKKQFHQCFESLKIRVDEMPPSVSDAEKTILRVTLGLHAQRCPLSSLYTRPTFLWTKKPSSFS